MKKMFLKSAAALTIMMAAASISVNAQTSGTCGATEAACSWSLNTDNRTLTITGNGAMTNYSPGNAPWYSNRDYVRNVNISGVTTIGNTAFRECSALTSVSIPSSVTTIGYSAFRYCYALTAINVDAANANYSSQDGVLFNKNKTTLLQYPASKQGAYTIPNSVTTISNNAFSYCRALTSVSIPSSVTTIGDNAFDNCTALTSVSIPNSVTTIGSSTFYGCRALTSVSIPSSVNTIGWGAFYNCSALTSVSIPSSVTYIGSHAFNGTALTSVSIPSSVTTIGDNAFDNCTALHSVTVERTTPLTGSNINSSSFPYAAADLYVPAEAVDAYRTTEPWSTFRRITAIGSTPAPVTFNCGYCSTSAACTPTDSVTATLNGNTLTITRNSGTGRMKNFGIGGSGSSYEPLWYNYGNLITNVVIEGGVTTIGDNAFRNYSALTSVSIPSSVTTIGDDAFQRCTALTAINVDAANANYSSQDGVLFNQNKTTLIKYPISKTGTSYTIPSSVTTIGDFAFHNCTALTSVSIPNSVRTIGAYAFYDCTALTSVSIPNSVRTIGAYAFYDCTALTSVSIPSGVTTIGNYAFYACTALTSVSIGSSVTTIGEYAFRNCSALTSVYNYAVTPPTINANVFQNVNTGACTLYVPAESVTAYQAAAVWSGFNVQAIVAPVTGMSVNYHTLALTVNSTQTLTASITPYYANNQNKTWSSSNANVASVSTNGLVTAVSGGTAVIRVVTEDGGFKDSCVVTVTTIPVTGVSVAYHTLTLGVGNWQTFTAYITPYNATNQNVTWSSSNESVASVSVSVSGVVTAVAAGTAVIRVVTEDGGFKDSCVVTVTTIPVTGVSVNYRTRTLTVGASNTLTAYITPYNATNQNQTWSSSNEGVASVSASGVVTAVAAGTAVIRVITEDGGFKDSCVVTVTAGPTAVDVQALPKLAVYPNPAGDMLYITDEYDGLVEIYDLSGALLLTSTSHSTNISALPSGIYIVKAGGKAAKVVKQ